MFILRRLCSPVASIATIVTTAANFSDNGIEGGKCQFERPGGGVEQTSGFVISPTGRPYGKIGSIFGPECNKWGYGKFNTCGDGSHKCSSNKIGCKTENSRRFTFSKGYKFFCVLFKSICHIECPNFSRCRWMDSPKKSQKERKCCGFCFWHQNNRIWLECTPKNSGRANFQCRWIGLRHEGRNRSLIGEAKGYSTKQFCTP